MKPVNSGDPWVLAIVLGVLATSQVACQTSSGKGGSQLDSTGSVAIAKATNSGESTQPMASSAGSRVASVGHKPEVSVAATAKAMNSGESTQPMASSAGSRVASIDRKPEEEKAVQPSEQPRQDGVSAADIEAIRADSKKAGKKGQQEAARLFKSAFESLQAGQLKDAAAQFEQGLEIYPGETAAHFYLAETYLRLDEVDKARRHFLIVQKLDPNSPEAAKAKPRLESVQKTEATVPVMVAIKGGCFEMGSPGYEGDRHNNEGLHQVCVDGFRLGKTEVTLGQFRRFVEATGYRTEAEQGDGCNGWTGSTWETRKEFDWRRLGFSQGEDHPVVCVSWNDATAYAEWLSRETGKKYRLPTEAEWEYAARAGTTTAFWWGSRASHEYANYGKEACCGPLAEGKDRWEFTAPVGSFPPNPWGLYDTAGNVWEWTCSAYVENYDGSEKRCSSKNDASARRVYRGGGWYSTPVGVRSAYRYWFSPGVRYLSLGFRLAQD